MSQHDPPRPKAAALPATARPAHRHQLHPPATKAQASREIKRLKALDRSPRHERDADRQAIDQASRGDSARVRDDEITGYGSNATWATARVMRGGEGR